MAGGRGSMVHLTSTTMSVSKPLRIQLAARGAVVRGLDPDPETVPASHQSNDLRLDPLKGGSLLDICMLPTPHGTGLKPGPQDRRVGSGRHLASHSDAAQVPAVPGIFVKQCHVTDTLGSLSRRPENHFLAHVEAAWRCRPSIVAQT